LRRAGHRALVAAAVGLIILIIMSIIFPRSFLRAYLAAYVLWSAVPLGAGAILMTHHLAAGRWGNALRPALESAVATVPLLPIFFLPILIGARWLYPWADPARLAPPLADETLRHQHPYLHAPFFIV